MSEEKEKDEGYERFERMLETIKYFCEMGNCELMCIELKDNKTGTIYGQTLIAE